MKKCLFCDREYPDQAGNCPYCMNGVMRQPGTGDVLFRKSPWKVRGGRELLERYARDPLAFDASVMEGIVRELTVDYQRGKGIQAEYLGTSANKLRRLVERYKQDPSVFLDKYPARVYEALKLFMAADKADFMKADAALTKCLEEQLPSPPEGYYWQHFEPEGPRSGHVVYYRLWHDKFSYMPMY